jgi:glucokinase
MGDMPTTGSRAAAPEELCLALDFGGTKIAAGLVNWRSGRLLRQERGHTAWERGAEAQIADMLALVGRLRLSPAEAETAPCVGVSFGGPVDVARGIVLHSHRVPGWDDLPLAARLREVLARPVVIENDANAVALGEYRYGAGRGVEDLVYLTVSTGIGGGIVLGGRLWRGSHGLAGEIGHMVIRAGGPLCSCGNRGCLESLASGLSIARRAREALHQQGPSTHLRTLTGGRQDAITAEMVFRAARAGDPLAEGVVRAVAEDLGLGIAMLCSVVDPARVLLGGGVAKAGEQLLAPVREAFRRHAFPLLADHVEIVPAEYPDDGGLLGAAALVAHAADEGLSRGRQG